MMLQVFSRVSNLCPKNFFQDLDFFWFSLKRGIRSISHTKLRYFKCWHFKEYIWTYKLLVFIKILRNLFLGYFIQLNLIEGSKASRIELGYRDPKQDRTGMEVSQNLSSKPGSLGMSIGIVGRYFRFDFQNVNKQI